MAEDTNPSGAQEIAAHLGRKDPFFGGANGPKVVQLSVALIDRNPDQPRKTFNEESLQGLANSIMRHGLLQPITVKHKPEDDRYLLVAGERRFRAFELLNRETIPAIITSGDADELALIENLQRENLKPVEEATALKRMQELHSWKQKELGEAMGKSEAVISMTLKVLDLPKEILDEQANEPEPLPKSLLLELARVKGVKRQRELYEQAKQGQLETARAMRAARTKGKEEKPEGDGQAEAPSPAQKVLELGRTFVRRLQGMTDEQLRPHRNELSDELSAMAELLRQFNERLTALPQDEEQTPSPSDTEQRDETRAAE
jgi:ParB family chromosome partitioning protein